jgi:hypothetical protein
MNVKQIYKIIEYMKLDVKKVLSKMGLESAAGALTIDPKKLELDVVSALNEIDN